MFELTYLSLLTNVLHLFSYINKRRLYTLIKKNQKKKYDSYITLLTFLERYEKKKKLKNQELLELRKEKWSNKFGALTK